ncbi:MAG: hypothetical protein PHS66_07810 [Candidatus Omnitrophica bacterium]|nr:hypothetical protein [Candidatus Omnitrophota bacterium]
MKKTLILTALIFTFISASSAGTVSCTLDNQFNSAPAPRLRFPIYETAAINARQPLEFSWWLDAVNTSGFILKVYKGFNMYADNLILKENLPPGASAYQASPDLFEDGKVYTWSLVRISFAGYKSDRSFNSFKVIKQQ